jgi:HrpA-like RNA helicase
VLPAARSRFAAKRLSRRLKQDAQRKAAGDRKYQAMQAKRGELPAAGAREEVLEALKEHQVGHGH